MLTDAKRRPFSTKKAKRSKAISFSLRNFTFVVASKFLKVKRRRANPLSCHIFQSEAKVTRPTLEMFKATRSEAISTNRFEESDPWLWSFFLHRSLQKIGRERRSFFFVISDRKCPEEFRKKFRGKINYFRFSKKILGYFRLEIWKVARQST